MGDRAAKMSPSTSAGKNIKPGSNSEEEEEEEEKEEEETKGEDQEYDSVKLTASSWQ